MHYDDNPCEIGLGSRQRQPEARRWKTATTTPARSGLDLDVGEQTTTIRLLMIALVGACASPPSAATDAGDIDATTTIPDAVTPDARIAPRTLIALAGQSNEPGQGNTYSLGAARAAVLGAPYPNVTLWDAELLLADGSTIYDLGPEPLQPRPYAYPKPNMGIELSLGRTLDAAKPVQWAEVKYGVSGSTLQQRWLPTSPWPTAADNLNHRWITRLHAAVAAENATLGDVVWFQGESDAGSQVLANAYEPNLETLINAERAADPAWTNTAWYVIELNAVNAGAYKDTVRAAQVKVAATLPNVYLVNIDDLPTSEHYSAPQLDAIGIRVGQAIVAHTP
jgi:hypothetical protein